MTYQPYKSRASMTVGERIEQDQYRRSDALLRREYAKDAAKLRALAAQGIRPHYKDEFDPFEPTVLRACEPQCWQHGGPWPWADSA